MSDDSSSPTEQALLLLGTWNPLRLVWYCFFAFAKAIPAVMSMMAFLWVAYLPRKWHCKVDAISNFTGGNFSVEDFLPKVWKANSWQVDSCHRYNATAKLLYNETIIENCLDGYTYEDPYGFTTIVTEWDLVCDRLIWRNISNSGFFVMSFFGVFVFCQLSDRFGRKKLFLTCLIGLLILSTVTAFSSNIWVFMGLRLFAGAFQQGLYVSGFCLGVELFSIRHRTSAGLADEFAWVAACLLQVLVVFFVRNWRYYFLVSNVPAFSLLFFVPWIPESITWLVDRRKFQEASEILARAGRYVKPKPLTADDFYNLLTTAPERHEHGQVGYSLWTLVQHPVMCTWILVTCLMWLTAAMSYFYVSQFAVEYGDPFVNTTLMNLVEAVAYVVTIPATEKFGRKTMTVLCKAISAGTFLLCGGLFLWLGNQGGAGANIYIIVLFSIVRLFVSVEFALIFLYTSEYFPTSLRTTAVGIGSSSARLGMTLAPYISHLTFSQGPHVMFSAYGIALSIITTFMALILPETGKRALPNTLEEIETWLWKRKDSEELKFSDNKQRRVWFQFSWQGAAYPWYFLYTNASNQVSCE